MRPSDVCKRVVDYDWASPSASPDLSAYINLTVCLYSPSPPNRPSYVKLASPIIVPANLHPPLLPTTQTLLLTSSRTRVLNACSLILPRYHTSLHSFLPLPSSSQYDPTAASAVRAAPTSWLSLRKKDAWLLRCLPTVHVATYFTTSPSSPAVAALKSCTAC